MSLGRVAILTILAVPVYGHRMSFFPCRRSASPVSREMQVKNHSEMSHLLEWLLPRRSTKCCWGCGGEGTLVHCWWELRWPLWKQYGGSSKLQNIWSFDPYPAIPLLGVYLKETKTLTWKIYAPLCSLQHYFLNTVVEVRRHPRCPSIAEWIQKLWAILK